MQRIRSSKFRNHLIALLLFAGIFPSIQAAFACEKIDARVQFKADCMQMDEVAKSCMDMQSCMGSPVSSSDDCCDLSHDIVAVVKNTSQDSSFLLLLLDGPQPPPVLSSSLDIFPPYQSIRYHRLIVSRSEYSSATDTYLKTQRLRI